MARTGDNTRIPLLGVFGGAPTFAPDLTELSNEVQGIVGERADTVSALPATGNWPGRTVTVDNDGVRNGVYSWSTADGWKPVLRVARLANGVASAVAARVQTGIVKAQGGGGPFVTIPLTFPIPFTATPVATANMMGLRPTGAYNDTGLANASETAAAQSVTLTGTTLYLHSPSTLSTAYDYYVSWVAIGA